MDKRFIRTRLNPSLSIEKPRMDTNLETMFGLFVQGGSLNSESFIHKNLELRAFIRVDSCPVVVKLCPPMA